MYVVCQPKPFLNGRGRKSLKNQTRDVIKMKEMRGDVEKKTPKKEMDNQSFL